MPLTIPPKAPSRITGVVPPGAMVLASAELLMDLMEQANPGVEFEIDFGAPETRETTYYVPIITRKEPTE